MIDRSENKDLGLRHVSAARPLGSESQFFLSPLGSIIPLQISPRYVETVQLRWSYCASLWSLGIPLSQDFHLICRRKARLVEGYKRL